MSKELQPANVDKCADFQRLSRSALDECLESLLAMPASNPQAGQLQRLLHELQVYQVELEVQNRELLESQQQLEGARDRYADLYDFAPVGYLTLSDKSVILGINLRGAAMLGCERGRLVGKPLTPLLARRESRTLFAHLTQVFHSTDRVVDELHLKALSGREPIVVRIESIAAFAVEGAAATCHTAMIDITDQKQTEDALREGKARFYAIFNQAAVGVAVIDACSGKFQQVNQKYSDIIGYSCQEMQALDFTQISHPDDLLAEQVKMQKLWTGEMRDFSVQKRLFRKDGSIIWVNITVSSLWSKGKSPSFCMAIVEDITRAKQAEAVLDGRHRVLELMARGAAIHDVLSQLVLTAEALNPNTLSAILLLDEQGKHLRLGVAPSLSIESSYGIDSVVTGPSGAGCDNVRLSGERVIVKDIMHESRCLTCRETMQRVGLQSCWSEPILSSTGKVMGIFTTYGREASTPTCEAIELGQGSAQLAGLAIERQRNEEQARQHQAELTHMARLNIMGELATGIAHELNQPLSAIATYADVGLRMVETGLKQPEKLREALQCAHDQAVRASEIISHLRQLVSKHAPQKTTVDLNELINQVIYFMKNDSRMQGVKFEQKLTINLPCILGDCIQIEQVLLNLLLNSAEVMQAASSLKRKVTVSTILNGDGYIQVAVADSGPGMSAETLERVFEPFVTTKGVKGMGMGLSICRSIIEAHGGRLWAESQLGHGATFLFTLPLGTALNHVK